MVLEQMTWLSRLKRPKRNSRRLEGYLPVMTQTQCTDGYKLSQYSQKVAEYFHSRDNFIEVSWNRSNPVHTCPTVPSGPCRRCFLRLSTQKPTFSNFRAKLCIAQLAGTLRPPRHSLCSACLTRCETLARRLVQGTHAPAMRKTWCSYPITMMVERGIKFSATCHLTWTRQMNHGWARHEIPGNWKWLEGGQCRRSWPIAKYLGFVLHETPCICSQKRLQKHRLLAYSGTN
jgi:hypothetical protein